MEIKIKKIQDKIKELQEQQAELDSSIEDIYSTINDWKYPIYPDTSTTPTQSQTTLHHPPNNITTSIDNISYFIDYIISLNPKRYQPYAKRQALTFYDYLNQTEYSKDINIDTQREQIKYFLELDDSKRQLILRQCQSINDLNVSSKPKIFKILESSLSDYHKKLALSKMKHLESMDTNDSEYFKLSQWLDNLLDIPFNKYKQPAFITQDNQQTYSSLFQSARTKLDSVIYGQSKTKQHILEIVARMISNPKSQGSVFAVEGEPGTGKTTLIKEGLSQVLGLPFIFISLGGAQDASYLAGENYTYIGSKCGKIIQELKVAQCMNPIFYFDELDKVSTTERGQEIINLLIHITDFAQNTHFLDYYMDGITVNLSRATFIFSFNDKSKICPVLLDRMEIIKFHSYSSKEKKYITEHYLLPNVVKQYFGKDNKIEITFKKNTKSRILNKIITNNLTGIDKQSLARKKTQNTSQTQPTLPIQPTQLTSNNIKKMLNIHYIMKRRMGIISKARYGNGGVRYIKRNLERIISRINIERIEKFEQNNTNIIIDEKSIEKVL